MPKDRHCKCPFHVTRSRSGKKRATITCEMIENDLGFDIWNQVLFTCHEEENNYYEIFCADMFETCPYYKAIYRYQEEKRNEKNKSEKKGGDCREKRT